jgi:cell division septum initiation protein DivIVA
LSLYEKASENEQVRNVIEKIKSKIDMNNKVLRSSLFGLGILVGITLLYLIISSLFVQKASTTIPEAYKNKLIEAALIIEKSNKDLGNREVFNENIKKAETLIFEVRDKQIFLNDVKKLLGDISILKKQINGIESFDPKTSASEYLFDGATFGLNGVFEVSKKLYFVGKTSLIGPYVK